MILYPLLFEPVLKSYLWGGRNLAQLGRVLPSEGVVAESWEIAAHEDGTTVVVNGPYAGKLLTEVHAELGLKLIGARNAWAQERGKFPLLIKLLDAAQPLSVQVHPGDDYALANEGNELGKTEMWQILRARPDAELIVGVTERTTRGVFREALLAGRPEPFLRRITVRAGDHVCVPAGTLHAITGGLIIAEVQQNSNTTYRVYDWNRTGPDGKPRALHIDKALDVIDFNAPGPNVRPPLLLDSVDGCHRSLLCCNRYFQAERVSLDPGAEFKGNCDGSTLEIWGVLEGRAVVAGEGLEAVRFILLPAALGKYTVTAPSGATFLRVYVP